MLGLKREQYEVRRGGESFVFNSCPSLSGLRTSRHGQQASRFSQHRACSDLMGLLLRGSDESPSGLSLCGYKSLRVPVSSHRHLQEPQELPGEENKLTFIGLSEKNHNENINYLVLTSAK